MHQGINLSQIARDLLDRRLYTTKSLGDAIGLSQPSVSRLARGLTKEIGASSALKLIALAGGTVMPPEQGHHGSADAKRGELHAAG